MQWTAVTVNNGQAVYHYQLKVTFEGLVPKSQNIKVQKVEVLSSYEIKPFAADRYAKMLEEIRKPEENIPPPPPPAKD